MNNTEFLKRYRQDKTSVWVKVKLTNDKEFYFTNYKGSWEGIKATCDFKNLFIKEFILQFRSHEVIIDIPEDADAFYFVRSILGQMGADCQHYYTVGIIKGDNVQKDMYIIPELIKDKSYEDNIESCFEEGIIYDGRKKKKEN